MFLFKMHYCFVISVIVILTSITTYGYKNPRIIGGVETTIEEYPYQVHIQKRSTTSTIVSNCGGSLIKSDVVLTAAHCMSNDTGSYYIVRAGSTWKDEGGEERLMRYFKYHPNYLFGSQDFDVAIIKLTKEFVLNSVIQIVKLVPHGWIIPDGTPATITGWGNVGYGVVLPTSILRTAKVNKFNYHQCKKVYSMKPEENLPGRKITNRMTCYGGIDQDSCGGDFGGPLVVNIYQVGIVSWGDGCVIPGSPGIYVDLQNMKIQKFINSYL